VTGRRNKKKAAIDSVPPHIHPFSGWEKGRAGDFTSSNDGFELRR
jgi:hypothetical protein